MERDHAGVLIIGGGVSGMAAAIAAARRGDRPLILEKHAQPGKKLLATGNGRCNLLNLNPPVYYGDSEFARQVMGSDPLAVLTDFWQELGLRLRFDPEGRGYPCTMMASTVLDVLKAEMKRLGVQVFPNQRVTDVRREKERFSVRTADGSFLTADRVVLSTGGAAQPPLGGNTDAFPWLQALGHRLADPRPALTPLQTDARSVSGLSGLKVRCRLTVYTDGKAVHGEDGELLFTETGISGICVMQCSRFVTPGSSEIGIDLISGMLPLEEDLLQDLRTRRNRQGPEAPPDLLRGLCAPKMAYAVCKQAGLSLRGECIRDLSDAELSRIARALRDYRVRILAREGFDRAQVMAGGLICSEVDPNTMESLRCPGLQITGELLNVDGDCGGYNLMFACASGLKAGLKGEIRL